MVVQFGTRSGKERIVFRVRAYDVVFWDFDGVIKDSVAVKTQAFFQLFEPFGNSIAERVLKHHEDNGGMSRFDKLPIYLEWAGLQPTPARVLEFCEKFSQVVTQGVIDSPWVLGVQRVLNNKDQNQKDVLISATPQAELEYILNKLELTKCFFAVYGAPIKKSNAIAEMLSVNKLNPTSCLMIGDATADMEAAVANQVPFLLRKHISNSSLFAAYAGPYIKDFSNV